MAVPAGSYELQASVGCQSEHSSRCRSASFQLLIGTSMASRRTVGFAPGTRFLALQPRIASAARALPAVSQVSVLYVLRLVSCVSGLSEGGCYSGTTVLAASCPGSSSIGSATSESQNKATFAYLNL